MLELLEDGRLVVSYGGEELWVPMSVVQELTFSFQTLMRVPCGHCGRSWDLHIKDPCTAWRKL